MAAGAVVKREGKPNDLMERIAADPLFAAVHNKLDQLVDPKLFIGRAKEQVEEFLADDVNPVLEKECMHLKKEVVDGVNV
jgi:adenylosuccinate lyase